MIPAPWLVALWQTIKQHRAEKRRAKDLKLAIAEAMAPERFYQIVPSGSDMWAAQYRTVTTAKPHAGWTLLGTFPSQQLAQSAIETNLQVFAASIAEKVLGVERIHECPPYPYPNSHRYHIIFCDALNAALAAKRSTVRLDRNNV